MVDVFNKELLSWYLITLQLKETVDAGIPSSIRSINSPSQDNQQPSDQLQIKINGDSENLKEGPRSSESEWIVTFREKLDLAQKDDAAGPYLTWTGVSGCVYQILKRGNQYAKFYIDTIKELEERARGCYEGNITVSSNEFVEIMVLDGCFVLGFFVGD